jgi:hypothetical protein
MQGSVSVQALPGRGSSQAPQRRASGCCVTQAMVPKNSGTQRKWMVRSGAWIFPALTSVASVRASSSIPPDPLALSLALHLGWSRWAVTSTSRCGGLVPRR